MRISDWSSDVCSSDLKELARLERRDNRAPDTFGRRREDNLNAQREPLLNEQEPWSDRSEERRVGKECVQYVSISVVAVSLKHKDKQQYQRTSTSCKQKE